MHTAINFSAVRSGLRWHEAVATPPAVAILTHLLKEGATDPQHALTYSAIARALGMHKWQVRRLIAGEGGKRKRRSLLQGLVHYPERYRHSGCYLTPEGVEVARRLAEGDPPTYRDLKALAEARQRRVAESHAKVTRKSRLPFPRMPLNYVCPQRGASKSPNQKPVNGLAEKLWRIYGMALPVANDVVARYDEGAISAAMELRERKNGAIYNPAGFILHLLKRGYAERYAEAKRARQDPDRLAEEVKKVVEDQMGVKVTLVNGSPAIPYRDGWLYLPLDPDRAVDLVERLLPRPARATDEPMDGEPDAPATEPPVFRPPDTPPRARQCSRCGAEGDLARQSGIDLSEPTDGKPDAPATEPDPLPTAPAEPPFGSALDDDDLSEDGEPDAKASEPDADDDDDLSDLSEPPEPACYRCGRKEGDRHPALGVHAQNCLRPLSALSEPVRRYLGVGDYGIVCRGCLTEALKALLTEEGDLPCPA